VFVGFLIPLYGYGLGVDSALGCRVHLGGVVRPSVHLPDFTVRIRDPRYLIRMYLDFYGDCLFLHTFEQ
jgi:hypothetical protein